MGDFNLIFYNLENDYIWSCLQILMHDMTASFAEDINAKAK